MIILEKFYLFKNNIFKDLFKNGTYLIGLECLTGFKSLDEFKVHK